MSETPTHTKVETSGLAVTALLLGLAAPCTLVTAPLALFFGYRALYAVNASDGRLAGRVAAITGMVLGGLMSVVGLVGAFAITIAWLRGGSERVECVNNLRVLGLAVNKYHDNNNQMYPRAVVPLEGYPPEERASWLAAVLPYLEEQPGGTNKFQKLAGRLDLQKPWEDPANREALTTYVAFYQCRGDPRFDPRANPGITHYVGIAGVGEHAAMLPEGHVCAGFFGYTRDLKERSAVDAPGRRAGETNEGRTVRETSHKMMVTETTQRNGPWIAGGEPTVRGVGFNPTFLAEQSATAVGLLAAPSADYGTPGVTALQIPRPEEPSLIGPGRPFGGLHAGGLNVLWVDGSVRFVADTIKPRTFRMHATLSDDAEIAALP